MLLPIRERNKSAGDFPQIRKAESFRLVGTKPVESLAAGTNDPDVPLGQEAAIAGTSGAKTKFYPNLYNISNLNSILDV